MESIRVSIPAQAGTFVVIRQGHNGEIVRRATISFEGTFSPSGGTFVFQLNQYRPYPLGQGVLVGTSGGLGSLTIAAGQVTTGYVMYDLVMPTTEGAFQALEENDLIVLTVAQNGTPIGFNGLTVGLG